MLRAVYFKECWRDVVVVKCLKLPFQHSSRGTEKITRICSQEFQLTICSQSLSIIWNILWVDFVLVLRTLGKPFETQQICNINKLFRIHYFVLSD
jgi:hypothetical protein